MNTKLYAITSIFNPFNFASRYRLYEKFKKHMSDCGVELFTIELAFGHDPFRVTTPDNPMNMQLRTNQILWHKERAVNLAAKQLAHIVPDFQYMAWLDADVGTDLASLQ